MIFLEKIANLGLSLHFLSVCLIWGPGSVILDRPQGLTS